MRIAVLAYNSHKNCAEGVARIHYNLYLALKNMGVEVNLISIIDKNFEDTFKPSLSTSDPKHEFYVFMDANKMGDRIISEVISAIKSLSLLNPDFVISGISGIKPAALLRLYKVLTRGKWLVVESLYSRPFKILDKCKYMLPLTYKIITYSPSEYRYLVKTIPTISKKVVLMPPPIDTNHFTKKNRRLALRRFGLDELEDKLVIGYVGNPFTDRFPMLKVFKALTTFTSRYDVALVLVFPPYKRRTVLDSIQRIANEFGLGKRVYVIEKFIEYHDRPLLYSFLDVLLHLYTWREAPYPFLVALESFLVGTPVVTTNYNEICWAIDCSSYPLLIDLAKGISAQSIRDVLDKYVSLSGSDGLNEILAHIRSRIIERFSFESTGKRLLRALSHDKS